MPGENVSPPGAPVTVLFPVAKLSVHASGNVPRDDTPPDDTPPDDTPPDDESSPGNMPLIGWDPNKSYSFYSICVLKKSGQTRGVAAVTLTWLLNKEDYDLILGMQGSVASLRDLRDLVAKTQSGKLIDHARDLQELLTLPPGGASASGAQVGGAPRRRPRPAVSAGSVVSVVSQRALLAGVAAARLAWLAARLWPPRPQAAEPRPWQARAWLAEDALLTASLLLAADAAGLSGGGWDAPVACLLSWLLGAAGLALAPALLPALARPAGHEGSGGAAPRPRPEAAALLAATILATPLLAPSSR